MRLWTLHPRYLDTKGLVAVWREALLAQKVLRGKTRGYRHHPQLNRFRESPNPLGAMAAYLKGIHAESTKRGYRFDASKILRSPSRGKIAETRGQLLYELNHLLRKVKARAPRHYALIREVRMPAAHSIFSIRKGQVSPHEKIKPRSRGLGRD